MNAQELVLHDKVYVQGPHAQPSIVVTSVNINEMADEEGSWVAKGTVTYNNGDAISSHDWKADSSSKGTLQWWIRRDDGVDTPIPLLTLRWCIAERLTEEVNTLRMRSLRKPPGCNNSW